MGGEISEVSGKTGHISGNFRLPGNRSGCRPGGRARHGRGGTRETGDERASSLAVRGRRPPRRALAAASAGDIIKVCAGTYNDQLGIQQSVTLQAHGAVTVVGPISPSNTLTPCDMDGGGDPNQALVDGGPSSINVTIPGSRFRAAGRRTSAMTRC